MLFVARSLICIGLVAASLPAPAGTGPGDLLQSTAASTAAALERYCAQNPVRCLQAARAAPEPARLPDGAAPRKLRSTAPPPRLRS